VTGWHVGQIPTALSMCWAGNHQETGKHERGREILVSQEGTCDCPCVCPRRLRGGSKNLLAKLVAARPSMCARPSFGT
jgi:hypothetical protein